MDTKFLSGTALFAGICEEEIEQLKACLGFEELAFPKGSYIYQAGDKINAFGLVLSGAVCIENNDIWGNRSILDSFEPGEVFAENYACLPDEPLPIHVAATENTHVLFINARRVTRMCEHACPYHSQLIHNLIHIMAQNNMKMARRCFYTATRSLRQRVLKYLSDQSKLHESRSFQIPFDRQQLADYLSVDRSALSNELSKLSRESILKFRRNRFELLQEIAGED